MDWDEASLNRLIQDHIPAVRSTLRRFADDPDELADLEQETFLRAMVYLPSLRDVGSFGPWVASIARTVALGRLRSAGRERANLERFSREPGPPEPAEIAEAGLIEYALRRLPPEIGRTIHLYYFEDLAGRSIAERLGCSEASVRQRLSRGRKQLREVILDMVHQDGEMGEMLVKRLLDTAKSLTAQGKYQKAVDRFMEAFDTSPGPLTALERMPEDLREALKEAWEHTFVYRPPEEFEEPAGPTVDDFTDWSGYADRLKEIPESERRELIGTIEDIGRRLQISPARVYLWWKQGLPHIKLRGSRVIRFNLALTKQWLNRNGIEMPPRAPAAESYFLPKGIAYGLREGILTPEDAEVIVEVFIERESRDLLESGSFSSLARVGAGCPPEGKGALERCAQTLTDVHRSAIRLRRNWTPNDGYTGKYPYDREAGARIAEELRRMGATLREAGKQLNTAVAAMERV